MFRKKKKEETDIIPYQEQRIERLEMKVDKLVSENEYLRARLHEVDSEDRELMRRSLRAQISKDESPFGQDILGESRD